jgi:hypothetical protein
MLERAMLERLIGVIEKNAAEITEDLKQRLLNDPRTSSYQTLDDEAFYRSLFELYSHLGNWLLADSEKGDIPTYYSTLGERWFEEGFALHEIVKALITTKTHVWDIIVKKGIMGTPRELDAAIDLITFLHRFFDMAIYYTTRGYYRPLGMKIVRIEMAKER